MLKQQQANIPVYMKDMDVTGTDTRAAETPRSYLVNVTRLDSVTCYDVSDSTLYIHLGLELAETKTLYLLVNESLNKPVKQTFFKLFGPETNQNNQHPKEVPPISSIQSDIKGTASDNTSNPVFPQTLPPDPKSNPLPTHH